MPRYRDLGGDSGVRRYALGDGWIDVTFAGGWTYRYTDASAGAAAIRAMHALARAGCGLNTFINQHIRDRYASRRPFTGPL